MELPTVSKVPLVLEDRVESEIAKASGVQCVNKILPSRKEGQQLLQYTRV